MEIQQSESFCSQPPSCILTSSPLLRSLMSFARRSRKHISEPHTTRASSQIRSLTLTQETTKIPWSCAVQRGRRELSEGELRDAGSTRKSVTQRRSDGRRRRGELVRSKSRGNTRKKSARHERKRNGE